jgi:chitodextrinase
MQHPYLRRFSFFVLFLLLSLAVRAQLQITYPTSRAIFQRNNQNQATLYVAGTYTTRLDRVEARLIPLDRTGTPTSAGGAWSLLQSAPTNGYFQGTLPATGGWYQLEVRGLLGGTPVGTATLDRVGVGEVFLIAGQSNSTGDSSLPPGPGATDDRVSSIDFQNTNFPVAYSNPAFPCPTFTHLDSGTKPAPFGNNAWTWGKFGDALAARLNVPVLIFNAGWAGSGITSWRMSTDSSGQAYGFGGYAYPVGMPYGNLRLALHTYIAQQGVRAVLWHQGETDNDGSTSREAYAADLQKIIQKSREHSGKSALAWVVARASRVTVNGTSRIWQPVIDAQNDVIGLNGGSPYREAQVFPGPETDPIQGPGVRDAINVHFEGDGHRRHGEAWRDALPDAFFTSTSTPYLAVPPPTLAVACTSPTQLTLSTTAGGALSWINANDCSGSLGRSASVTVGAGTYRLRQRDPATGNIVFAPTVVVPSTFSAEVYPSCGTPPVADTQAPGLPTNVRTSNVAQTTLTLNWDASTDNVGVTGYDVYQGGTLLSTVAGTSYNVTGLTGGTQYTFSVRAKDAAGNTSAPGSTTATTTSAPGGCTPTVTYLSDLSWSSATNGWGDVEKDRANGEQAAGDGPTIRLNGQSYTKGLGAHAASRIVYALGGTYTRFKASVGLDDSKDNSPGSVVFEVLADGQSLFKSGTMTATTATATIDVDVTGKQQLELLITDAGNGVDSDHGSWADARLERSCGTPPPVADTQAPGLPTNVRTSNVAQTTLTLSWDASTDNVGVTGYNVYQGSTLLGTVAGTSYNVTGLTAATAYTFSVRAKDAAGNTSAPGSTSVTTASASTPPPCTPTVTYLSDLSWSSATNGWGPVERDRSNGEQAGGDGRPLTLNGTTYAKGLGVHSPSEITYNLGGTYSRFRADIGIDDEVTSGGTVVFEVWADGQRLYQSGVLTSSSATVAVNVDVTGKQQLRLVVTNADGRGAGDHADWADARLERTCGTPPPVADTQAPGLPTNVRTSNVAQTTLTLSWDASTDNVGVTGYDIYQGSTLLGSVTGTSYNVTGLTAATAYTFSVRAKDAAGNTSAPGSTSVTTASAPGGCTPTVTYLSDLSWTSATNGWGPVEKDKANGEANAGDGPPLKLGTKTYAKGLGVHSLSEITYSLNGGYTQFKADVGLADYIKDLGSVVFQVYTDGTKVYDSGLMTPGQVKSLSVDLTGKSQLRLVVTNGDGRGRNDHANWADARLERTCGSTRRSAPALASAAVEPLPLRVFPNPATEAFRVAWQDEYRGTLHLDLLNLHGERLYTQRLEKTGERLEHTVPAASLPAGVYVLRIGSGAGVRTLRVVLRP